MERCRQRFRAISGELFARKLSRASPADRILFICLSRANRLALVYAL